MIITEGGKIVRMQCSTNTLTGQAKQERGLMREEKRKEGKKKAGDKQHSLPSIHAGMFSSLKVQTN